ncbi:SDR family oxidoreductase [Bacteroidia bacterium]|mgnify:CR=1 FL=1|jgi:short-subunit dehydrogenase|nr:SDR family oxidoreductase [Bacteroidota bacterium]MDA8930660.1 SDR family oxidoreductase [Bacteroidia bacterium]MDA9110752.1 SDR family oxidoreductase [Bacteroidia bacterium]
MTALITGASAGIGLELAREFAQDKIDLVLVARREERLTKLAQELETSHGISVTVILQDLSEPSAAEVLFQTVQDKKIDIHYLVNNAGFGDVGEFVHSDMDKQHAMINLNVLTLTKLTRLFGAVMKEKGSGTILNVASDAAFRPGPMMSVYFATKHYVLAFSEAIAEELKPYGVVISILCPGATQSEFGEMAGFGPLAEDSPFPTSKEVAAYGYEQMKNGEVIVVHGKNNQERIAEEKDMTRRQVRERVYEQMGGVVK